MNRTAEMFFGSFIMVSLIVMAIDALVIIAAARNNSQHNARFCIIGNISLADLVTVAMTDIILIDIISEGKLELDLFMLVNCTITGVAHLVSILSNLFLSIDRFIAVKFCLAYHNIIIQRRVLLSIFLCWLFSLSVMSLLTIRVSSKFQYFFRYAICITVFRVLVGILMIATSIYTSVVRRSHILALEKRKKYFGVHQEKLDMLNALTRSLKDTFKLNITTAIIVFIQSVFDFLRASPLSANLHVNVMALILLLLLKLSNFIAIIMTQSDLRRSLKKMCCRWHSQRVENFPTNLTGSN